MKVGDKIYVKSDGRAYMEATINKIEDGQVYGDVTWAVIISFGFRCAVSDVEMRGDRLVVDYGYSACANVNAARFPSNAQEPRP